MQNQNIEQLGSNDDMFEQFKKFMSQQKGQEQPQQNEKKQTKKPVITVQKMAQQIPPPPPPINDESDDEIELKPKQTKAKRPMTEKQRENLIKGREKRDELRRQRAEEKARQDAEYKKQVEDKLVKKAIQIKKKQIKEQKLIEPDPESEDDKTLIKSKPKRTAPSNPHQPVNPSKRIYFL